jgi:hypothetical protein
MDLDNSRRVASHDFASSVGAARLSVEKVFGHDNQSYLKQRPHSPRRTIQLALEVLSDTIWPDLQAPPLDSVTPCSEKPLYTLKAQPNCLLPVDQHPTSVVRFKPTP